MMPSHRAVSPERKERLERVKKNRQFNIIKDLHKNIHYLNPDENKVDPAVQEMFLGESNFEDDRQEIKLMLTSFRDLLKSSKTAAEFQQKGQEQVDKFKQVMAHNKKAISKGTVELEKPLRQLDLFYKNTGQEKLEDLTVMVYNQELLKKDKDDLFYKALNKEVKARYEAVDQGESVGYIVLPSYPGDLLLGRLAELANKNRTLLITSYRDLPNVQETFNFLAKDKVGGPQLSWSNVAIFANTIIAEDGMRLSPAAAVGGRMYIQKISQPVAGYLHGEIKEVAGLAYNVSSEEVNLFKEKGVIPLLNAWKQDMPYGMWTAYLGPDVDFQQYAIVRVRDWIARCLNDHLRKCAFNLTDKKVLRVINMQISDFLLKIAKNGIIDEGEVAYFDQNNLSPDHIHMDLEIKYLYAIRLFTYKFISSKDKKKESLEVS